MCQPFPRRQVRESWPTLSLPREGQAASHCGHSEQWRALMPQASRPQREENTSFSKPTRVQPGYNLFLQVQAPPLTGRRPCTLSHKRALGRKRAFANSELKTQRPSGGRASRPGRQHLRSPETQALHGAPGDPGASATWPRIALAALSKQPALRLKSPSLTMGCPSPRKDRRVAQMLSILPSCKEGAEMCVFPAPHKGASHPTRRWDQPHL